MRSKSRCQEFLSKYLAQGKFWIGIQVLEGLSGRTRFVILSVAKDLVAQKADSSLRSE